MPPNRIVSLVPSLTEALFAFGAGERVVGRTRYCLWPPRAVGKVPTVGGTKKVDVRHVLALEPDLIVAVREENSRENVEKLEERRRASLKEFVISWAKDRLEKEMQQRLGREDTELMEKVYERELDPISASEKLFREV